MGKDTAMDRITQPLDKQGSYIVDLTQVSPDPGGCTGEAITGWADLRTFMSICWKARERFQKSCRSFAMRVKKKL